MSLSLKHLLDERVDLVLAVSTFTTLDKVRHLLALEATGRVGEMEGP